MFEMQQNRSFQLLHYHRLMNIHCFTSADRRTPVHHPEQRPRRTTRRKPERRTQTSLPTSGQSQGRPSGAEGQDVRLHQETRESSGRQSGEGQDHGSGAA